MALHQDEKPGGMVTLRQFWIDQTEVTTKQYEQCVTEGECRPAKGGRHCNTGKGSRARHPINCVTWHQASAYCKWAGGRLPTEAEWEKSARGPAGRFHTWPHLALSCDQLVWAGPKLGRGCGQKSTWAVGSKPAGTSPYGAVDMLGNVWEWVDDAYDAGFYAGGGSTDPHNTDESNMGVMRGGGWGDDKAEDVNATRRFKFFRLNQSEGIGFRCAGD